MLGNNICDNDERPREVEEEEAKKFCEDKDIMWGGEIYIKNCSVEQLNEIIINSWKAYVQKFGIKEISATKKIEGSKWIKKKKKKKISDIC